MDGNNSIAIFVLTNLRSKGEYSVNQKTIDASKHRLFLDIEKELLDPDPNFVEPTEFVSVCYGLLFELKEEDKLQFKIKIFGEGIEYNIDGSSTGNIFSFSNISNISKDSSNTQPKQR